MYDAAATTVLLGADHWAQRLGIRVNEVSDQSLTLSLTLDADHLNFLDGAHGGALFSLAETAAAVAAGQRGSDPVLVDAHLALTSGGRSGDVLSATVTDISVGRTLAVFKVTVQRGDGRLVGEMTATMRFGT